MAAKYESLADRLFSPAYKNASQLLLAASFGPQPVLHSELVFLDRGPDMKRGPRLPVPVISWICRRRQAGSFCAPATFATRTDRIVGWRRRRRLEPT